MQSNVSQILSPSYEAISRLQTPWAKLLVSCTIPVIFVLFWSFSAVYHIYFHPLGKVPGPWLAKISQPWRNHRYFRGTWHDDAIKLHQKYGNVVRIAPDELSFVDEAAMKALYGHGQKVVKSKWYDTWMIPSMTVSFFAARDVKGMEPFIQDVAQTMWHRLGQFADSDAPVPMDDWANFFAFDVVGTLAMGGPIGFIERGVDVDGIIKSIHDGFWLMANMGNMLLQMFWFNNPLAQWALRSFGGERLQAFSKFFDWLEGRIDERYRDGPGDKRRDMLQLFIDAKDMPGQPVQKGDVMIEGVNILGAGADTTTFGILAILGALLTHPENIPRLQEEIDVAYSSLGLDKSGEDITYAEAAQLPFLSAVIKESTRLHPSIQYQLPRVVGEGGVRVGDFEVPQGMICGISPTTMNRSVEIFGADADQWKPERWIATDAEHEERIKYWNTQLTTFGMGSRSCVGKNLAMVEMFEFTAQFFRRFNVSLYDKERPWEIKTQWFSFQKNFWVYLQRRDKLR